ncbi:MAG: hypothetical protein EA377_05635 [Phycisphaerales bacterium]|nr:MAG: hypothetical protein EA377_05635 [Phycisphaerales bacterium]
MLMAALIVLPLTGCQLLVDQIGGAFDPVAAEELEDVLSPGANELLERALSDLDLERFADAHVHHITREIHPSWRSWRHPIRRLRTEVYMSGAGVEWGDDLEAQYIDRLERLIAHFPEQTMFFLYALERAHDEEGTPKPDMTPIDVPNESVWEVFETSDANFVPVISIHPAREDAIERLHAWADRGARYVKWLPNTMLIDPADEAYDPFYDAMRECEMILLTHTGHEHAVEAASQEVGNPLRLRRPLDRGVTVVALHAASDGSFPDLDDKDAASSDLIPGIELLLRMMDEPSYEELLFAELSAITFVNHLDEALRRLLERPDLHHRLINGSDYPIPAVNVVVQTRALQRHGLITAEEREHLNEIYRKNPLLFDFVVKRTVRHPETGARFDPEAFLLPEGWPTVGD